MRSVVLCTLLATALALGCADAPGPLSPAAGSPAFGVLPGVENIQLSAPVFDLSTAPDGSLLAAETLAGVTEVRKGASNLVAALGGVAGVASIGRGDAFAVTGAPLDPSLAPNARKLFRVSAGAASLVVDLGQYEDAVNPDQVWNTGAPDSNPFNLAHLNGGNVLVADAAGNDILYVSSRGSVDWVAVLTPILASTAPYKMLIGCGGATPPPACTQLPDAIPAQPVATSVAVGPDGAYYAGELTGFPGTPGLARVWRIEPGSRHVLCPSASCTEVASGLTSIMDLAFGPDGTLYVVELDEGSWLGVEETSGGFPIQPFLGGTVNACDVGTGSCVEIATGLALPTAVTVGKDGTVYVSENTAIPFGAATIRAVS